MIGTTRRRYATGYNIHAIIIIRRPIRRWQDDDFAISRHSARHATIFATKSRHYSFLARQQPRAVTRRAMPNEKCRFTFAGDDDAGPTCRLAPRRVSDEVLIISARHDFSDTGFSPPIISPLAACLRRHIS